MHSPTQAHIFVRYLRYLLWEFRWPLLVFWGLVLVGGLVLQAGYHQRNLSYGEACYTIFLLIFLQPGNVNFPDEWYLQIAFFLLPIIGLGALADSVVRLGYLIFTQKQKLPEWQQMVASLYNNHFVVVGAGKLGVHVIRGLVALREAVVAVERNADSPFLEEINDLQVPVIVGDARQTKTLEKAGVRKARAVLLTTNDDLANLDAAVTARELNPQANVVMKIFDETLGRKVGGMFRLPAISSAQVSAPAFIAAATGHKVYHNFHLGDREVHLTDLTICPTGRLAGRTVGHVQADREVNIVAHQGPGGVNVNPGPELVLNAGDTILVIAPIPRLLALNEDNQPAEGRPA